MKKMAVLHFLIISTALWADNNESSLGIAALALKQQYLTACQVPSDINEHVPCLRKLAMECTSVVELGLRGMNSTWGILQGLTESPYENKSYMGIDLDHPELHKFQLLEALADACGIQFAFLQANDLYTEIEPSDMLFIDTFHTYAHLITELERYSPKIRKYIAMHDTSEPFGNNDEAYTGDYSEYPDFVDKKKRGTWTAVWDFLIRHPEWKIQERHFNNHGFTILKRVRENP